MNSKQQWHTPDVDVVRIVVGPICLPSVIRTCSCIERGRQAQPAVGCVLSFLFFFPTNTRGRVPIFFLSPATHTWERRNTTRWAPGLVRFYSSPRTCNSRNQRASCLIFFLDRSQTPINLLIDWWKKAQRHARDWSDGPENFQACSEGWFSPRLSNPLILHRFDSPSGKKLIKCDRLLSDRALITGDEISY